MTSRRYEGCPACDGTGCPCLRWGDWLAMIDDDCGCGCSRCGRAGPRGRLEFVLRVRWMRAFDRDHPQYRWRLAIGPIEIRKWR